MVFQKQVFFECWEQNQEPSDFFKRWEIFNMFMNLKKGADRCGGRGCKETAERVYVMEEQDPGEGGDEFKMVFQGRTLDR